MNQDAGKKYWMTVNTPTWIVILVVSFFAIFPGFIALLVIWAMGRVKVIDSN